MLAGAAGDKDAVSRCAHQVRGWAAGWRLGALALGCRALGTHALAGPTGQEHALDYLVAEVLAGQPLDRRELLTAVAVLDRACGALLDAVLGVDGARRPTSPHSTDAGTLSAQPTASGTDARAHPRPHWCAKPVTWRDGGVLTRVLPSGQWPQGLARGRRPSRSSPPVTMRAPRVWLVASTGAFWRPDGWACWRSWAPCWNAAAASVSLLATLAWAAG
jgi:LuxR family maltose regulon positive regulatory protein